MWSRRWTFGHGVKDHTDDREVVDDEDAVDSSRSVLHHVDH